MDFRVQAEKKWNLEKLLFDLGQAKKKSGSRSERLSDFEQDCLFLLLCGYGPSDIARYRNRNLGGVRSDLSRQLYEYIAQLVGQRPKDWRDIPNWLEERGYRLRQPTSTEPEPIDVVVQQVRGYLRERILHDCDIVPLWGRNPGKSMAEMFVSINLICRTQSIYDYITDEQSLISDQDPDTFGRIFNSSSTQRVSGESAIQEFNRLLIYGKPGSGKTTYFRWIALQCVNGNLLESFVPILISFNAFSEADNYISLNSCISNYLAQSQINNAEQILERFLVEGRLLILFDGFDELPKNMRLRVQNELCELFSRFQKCRFLISCRPPLRIPNLIGFETFEIAEFRAPQVRTFAKQWFELISETDHSDKFLERLRRHRAISELAKTPLILPMLCSVFDREGEFPGNRIALYRKSFEILFEEWNELRLSSKASSNAYNELPTKAKKVLLSVIAVYFFKNEKILLYRNDLEEIIENFLCNDMQINPMQIDSNKILEEIEFQHGLIVRRSANYFSFSHLTFQEYLTAVYLVSRKEYPLVYSYILDSRWKFVIEIIAELLQGNIADDFLLNLKQQLDEFIKSQHKLREFISWLDQFVNQFADQINLNQPYKNTLLRAIYFVFCTEDNGQISGFTSLSKRRDFELPEYYLVSSVVSDPIIDLHGLLFRVFHAPSTDHIPFFTALKKMPALTNKIEEPPHLNVSIDAWLFQVEQQMNNHSSQSEFWYYRHDMWKDRVRQFLHRYFQVKCDWNFSDNEKTLLRQYYEGTKLLTECLNLSKPSKKTYQYIVNSLLKLGT